MFQKYLKQAIASTILLVFIIGIATITNQEILKQNDHLQKELSSFIVPPITINSIVYDVRDGRVFHKERHVSLFTEVLVLRIAYYSVLNRLNPLFALEGTDPQALNNAVKSLSASLDNFASFYNRNEEKIIRETFYPLPFLKELGQLEKLRYENINTPSKDGARKYKNKLSATIKLYIESVEKLKKTFTSLDNPLINNRDLNFLGGFSNTTLFLEFLRTIEQSALENNRIADQRAKCLKKYTKKCTSLKKISTKNNNVIFSIPTKDLKRNISEKIIENKNILIAREPSDEFIIVREKSKCFPSESPVYYLPTWRNMSDGNSAFKARIINDLYFYDLEKITGTSYKYFNAIKSTGATFTPQPIENMYMCPDSGKEIAQVLKLHSIYTLLKENPIFIDEISDQTRDRFEVLIKLEKEITMGDVLYEYDVAIFIDSLSSLLKKQNEIVLAQIIGKEKVFFIEKLIAIYNQNSAHFDALLSTIVNTNKGLETILGTGQKILLKSLFFIRSYPMATFLAFNKSFIEAELSMLEYKKNELEKFKLVSYNDYLSNIFTPQEIIEKIYQRRYTSAKIRILSQQKNTDVKEKKSQYVFQFSTIQIPNFETIFHTLIPGKNY